MTAAGPMEPAAGPVDPALLEELVHAGKRLPDEVRQRILDLGRTVAVPPLLQVLESDTLALEDAPGARYAAIHAVELLEELEANEAIEPMLRLLARCDVFDVLFSKLVSALRSLGPPVLEPALAAHAAAETNDQRVAVEEVLSGLGVRDDRILRILLGSLGRTVERGAGFLAEYGDDAALPALGGALDACKLDSRGGFFANSTPIELEAAIEALGGTLTLDQERKLEEVRAARDAVTIPLRSIGAPDDDQGEADDEALDDLPELPEESRRLLEQFAASPHAADVPDPGWIQLLLEYADEFLDTPFKELDGEALEEVVFEIFPRRVSCEPDTAPEIVRSLRAFFAFARDVLAHPHAEECLRVLGEDSAARLERALADPSNFGPAKSFAMSGAVPGLSPRLGSVSEHQAGSGEDRRRKKKLRKLRKKAQRRNRR